MEDKVTVSAVITTHNRIDLLKRAIGGVKKQTYPVIECIVVDDASDDGTKEYCESLKWITYIRIRKEDSKGGNYARNLGIKAARGMYIAFCDDDDYWLDENIEKKIAVIKEKSCKVVFSGLKREVIDKGNVLMTQVLPKKSFRGDMSKTILYNTCTVTSTLMIERGSLSAVGLFDEDLKFWQDYELLIRLAQRNQFEFINEALVVYRVDQSDVKRLTNKYWKWREAVKYIREKHNTLYNRLRLSQRLQYRLLVVNDGILRAQTSGLITVQKRLKAERIYLTSIFKIMAFLKGSSRNEKIVIKN